MKITVPEAGYFRALTPCREACPVNTDAGAYVRAIARGEWNEAFRIARAPNPLASICGRVCAAPCESACRRGAVDEAVSIRALKRAALEHSGYDDDAEYASILDAITSRGPGYTRTCEQAQDVAVIGSGPAGLSCAHDLALLGHKATIYERESVAAGMLMLGIPEYRLPRALVKREVAFIEALGVDIRCNQGVGEQVTMDELLERHDHVVVAVGASRSRMLPLPGIDGRDVMGGVEFLRAVHLGRTVELGERVVVVGGGNVAFDVARTAVRKIRVDVGRMAARQEGVGAVSLVCLERRDEMPADDVEVIEGLEEGIDLRNGLGPAEVMRGADGAVTGLRCQVVERVYDDDGRFSPTFTDEFVEIEADTLLFAIGQRFDVPWLQEIDGLELEGTGAPSSTGPGRTTHERVWVAGDLATGPGIMIQAVRSGKDVAWAIHEGATGQRVRREMVEVHVPLPGYKRERDYELRLRDELPAVPVEERIVSHALVVEEAPTQLWARHEAARCLNCSVHTVLDPTLCILCGGCVDVCPMACLKLTPLADLDLGERRTEIPVEVLEGSSALIKDETACIRCGLCAHRCPNDALRMEMCELQEVEAA